jgi:hypothetical protein
MLALMEADAAEADWGQHPTDDGMPLIQGGDGNLAADAEVAAAWWGGDAAV